MFNSLSIATEINYKITQTLIMLSMLCGRSYCTKLSRAPSLSDFKQTDIFDHDSMLAVIKC